MTTLTFSPPLPCCTMLKAMQRCLKPASTGQASLQADGSFYLQPICPDCAKAMHEAYFGTSEKASEPNE